MYFSCFLDEFSYTESHVPGRRNESTLDNVLNRLRLKYKGEKTTQLARQLDTVIRNGLIPPSDISISVIYFLH